MSKNDGDYTEGIQEMKKKEGGEKKKHRKIQNDRAKPRSGQKMKER